MPPPPTVSHTPEAIPPRPNGTVATPVAELAGLIGVPVPHVGADTAVTGVTLRAQQVRSGDLYAALPSVRGRAGGPHGAEFAATALGRGAVAVLTDPTGAAARELAGAGVAVLVHPEPRAVLGRLASRIHGDPSQHLAVLGVTGTSGKTTTSYLLESGLRAAGATTGMLGTVESRIRDHRLPATLTTPEAPELQALLAVMVERGVTHLPMEVSSHALALGRVGGIAFAAAGFTNLSQDHLDFHTDLEDYFAAKARLFDGRAAHEIVCIDDAWGRRLAGPGRATVSLDGAATWRACDIEAMATGQQRFRVLGPGGLDERAVLRLPGAFNVTNALLAVAMGHAAGGDPGLLLRGIADAEVPGRMQRIERGQRFLALVDYAHKPGALAALLDAVRARASGRVLIVLGCGGDRDSGKRPLMGAVAAQRADLVVVTDDNPRNEDPAAIRAAVLAGAREQAGTRVIEVGERAEAIRTAVRAAGPADAVVVAGKGHETGQEVRGVTHPFDDAGELAAALDGTEPRPEGR